MDVNQHLHNSTCTTAPAQCRVNLAPAQYKHHYYLAPPQSLWRKQIKTKLMLCKPLFIVQAELKAFKSYTTVQKWSASVAKVGGAHA